MSERGMPAVTIVIPLYQKERTVRRALDSVLRQSFANLEVLVVDDGSTDGGPAVVAGIAATDPRVRLLRRKNGGPGAAKNTGLQAASGEWIMFLDADDEIEPPFLTRALDALRWNPDCDVFGCAFRIGPWGHDRWDELREAGLREGVWRLTPDIDNRELALCLAVLHSCSSVYRTETVRRLGGFFDRDGCRFGEDVYLWVQLMLHCAFVRSFDVLAWYHTDGSDLGLFSGRHDIPLEPVFTNPGPIRAGCPEALRDTLERWLAFHAVHAVHLHAHLGHRDEVTFLLDRFPRVRRHRRVVLSARLKLRAPGLMRLARAVIARRGGTAPTTG